MPSDENAIKGLMDIPTIDDEGQMPHEFSAWFLKPNILNLGNYHWDVKNPFLTHSEYSFRLRVRT